jgi:starch phosphorylase
LSEYVNGVAERHAEVARRVFPGYRIHAITNGVHPHTWTCASFAHLYDRYLPGWCHEPEFLVRVDQIPDDEVWAAHVEAKDTLVAHIEALSGMRFRPDVPILGFARRMTAYKRPDLLFSDLERLKAIASKHPFQLVLAGKAHPRDEGGKHLIEALQRHLRELSDVIPGVFFPNYGMDRARDLVSGVDVWLNTPLRPLEASGTSGMKAAFNGVPSLSVLDGWWIEGCIEGVTGWAVGAASDSPDGDDAASLYEKLDQQVLPLFHGDRRGWVAVMKGAIGKNASYFNSHRMMRRYATEAYIR